MQSSLARREGCKACGHPRPKNAGYTALRTTLKAMLESAQQGCDTCSILSRGIQKSRDSQGFPKKDDPNELRIDFKMGGFSNSLEVALINCSTRLSFFTLKITPWQLEKLPDLSLGNEVPDFTASDETFYWIQQQLKHCNETHKICKPDSAHPLPRRVVDVGTGEHDVRLYESMGESEPYTCLSHCWGRCPLLCTMAANFTSHTAQIKWGRLPLTFQEAIISTRRLGIRYLWIDSLCIIQDDQLDWRLEATKMAVIFRNAYLVITAAKSAAADGGLFAQLAPKFKSSALTIPGKDGMDAEIRIRECFAHTRGFLGPLSAASSLPQFPTLKRGWIFQERFLASRVVHFGSEEVSWECLEASNCQCTQEGSISTRYDAAEAPVWLKNMLARASQPKLYYNIASWISMDDAEREASWHHLVEDYSHLLLTYEKDIFPALSGLAKQFQSVESSRYLAGLWEKSLLKDLLWHADVHGLGDLQARDLAWSERPRRWRAPTWSWASLKTPVKFEQHLEGFVASCEVLEVDCFLAGPDPTGELTGGRLLLRGHLVPTSLQYMALREHDEVAPWNLMKLDILDGRLGNVHADYNSSRPGSGYIRPDTKLFCFFVGRKNSSEAAAFLILKFVGEQSTTECQTYERVGLLELFGGPPGPQQHSWIDGVLAGGKAATVEIL